MADTILLKASRGLSTALATAPIVNGSFRITSDTQKIYFDIDDVRLALNDLVLGNTEAQIKAIEASKILPKIYLSSDTFKLFVYDTTNKKWVVAGGDSVAHSASADQATNDSNGNKISDTYETKTDAQTSHDTLQTNIDNLSAKVDTINSFEIKLIDSISNAPNPGASNVIYFTKDANATDSNKYDEYIWVTDSTETKEGHYENIGTTEAELSNYYTKTEIDAKIKTLETADATLQGNIDTLSGTVDTNKTATDKAIADQKTAYETADKDLDTKISDLTTTVSNNKGDSDSIRTDLTALQGTVETNRKNAESADADRQTDIKNIQDDVAKINRFKKEVVTALPDVADADDYTLYFVPEGDHYAEYMTVQVDASTKKFEKINSTSELANYYDKTEIDSKVTALESADTTNGTAIDKNKQDIATLTKTVSDNKTASDNADTALDTRVKALETSVGGDGTSENSLSSRVATLETTVASNKTDADTKISDLTTTVSDNKSTLEAADTDASNRITVLETAVGKYPTVEGTKTITTRLSDIESAIGDGTGETSLTSRVSTLETTVESNKSDADSKIESLTKTVNDNKTASDDADKALDTRVTSLETDDAATKKAIGNYPTTEGTKDITTRLSDIETAATTLSNTVSSNKTDTDTKISDLTKTVTNNKTALDATDTDLQSQITELKTNVGKINKFEIKVLDAGETLPETGESYTLYFVPVADGQDTNGGKTKYTEYMWIDSGDGTGYFEEIGITEAELGEYYTAKQVDDLLAPINTNISELQSTVTNNKGDSDKIREDLTTLQGTVETNKTAADKTQTDLTALTETVSNNKTAAETADSARQADIKAINDELAKHTWNYAGSASEGGAATKIVETEATDAVKHDVVIANADHDAAEFTSKLQVTPSTGDVTTAGTVTGKSVVVDSIVLGGATVTYDATSDTLVVDFK